jgi:hypothetical protein
MSVYLPRKNVPGQKNPKKMISRFYLIAIFFFFLPFPFLPYGFYGTFSVGRFSIHFPLSFPLSFLLGDATGLRGTFPGHPRPFHLTFTDIHNNIYTPMGAFPDGTRTRACISSSGSEEPLLFYLWSSFVPIKKKGQKERERLLFLHSCRGR